MGIPATHLLLEREHEIKRELWFRGNLRHLTRPGPQRDAYDWIHGRDRSLQGFSPFVCNFHRRLGKTFLSVLLCIEECLRRPGVFAKLAAPSLTMAADILEEHWAIIMQECPPELEPKPYRKEKFTFRNPRWATDSAHAYSILRLYGVQNDKGNKMRGGSTDIAVLDECREMDHLEYTYGNVLLPTFRGRKEPLAIMISTPPDSMDHPWVSKYIKEAREKSRYRCIPAAEDPNWTQEEDDLFAREMGGRDSPSYRREIQCELISDASALIIPEFSQRDYEGDGQLSNELVVAEVTRPDYYVAYTMADMGGAGQRTDHTGILFGFLDFQSGFFMNEHELFLRDMDTASIAKAWKKKAEELYGADLATGRCRRLDWFADATEQQLVDFYRLYAVAARNVPKLDRDVARRLVRTAFNLDKIMMSEDCVELQYQLRNGARTKTGDFERSTRLGHCDLVAALIGLYRMLDFEENPYPKPEYNRENYFVPPTEHRIEGGWNRYFRRMNRG